MEQWLERSGSRVPVRVEASFPDHRLVGGKYHPASHSITLYRETIRKQCLLLLGSLERLEDYIAIILAHELGHAEDGELQDLCALLDGELPDDMRDRIVLRIEVNAWRYARQLLKDESDSALLDQVVMESLALYGGDAAATAVAEANIA